MATKLDKTIKRELEIDGQAYMISIMPTGVKMTKKGFRNGPEMTWKQILVLGRRKPLLILRTDTRAAAGTSRPPRRIPCWSAAASGGAIPSTSTPHAPPPHRRPRGRARAPPGVRWIPARRPPQSRWRADVRPGPRPRAGPLRRHAAPGRAVREGRARVGDPTARSLLGALLAQAAGAFQAAVHAAGTAAWACRSSSKRGTSSSCASSRTRRPKPRASSKATGSSGSTPPTRAAGRRSRCPT